MFKILQIGGFLVSSFGMPDMSWGLIKGFFSLANSIAKESKNMDAKKINNDILVDTGLNVLGKKIEIGNLPITDSGVTHKLTKDIVKVIKSLENRGILLKGSTRKITSQEGGFLNFLRPLMTAGLLLIKSVLTPLAKVVLIPLGLWAGKSEADASI